MRGLYYARNRFYDPILGRFLQRDPNETALPIITALAMNGEAVSTLLGGFDASALYSDGMNLYQFAGSNPVNGRDASGLGNAISLRAGGAVGLMGTMAGMMADGWHAALNVMMNLYGTALAYGAQLTTFMYNGTGPLALDPAVASAFGDDVWRFYEAASDQGARAWDAFYSASRNAYNNIVGSSGGGSGGDFWQNLDPRFFRRFLESLQSLAARTQGADVRALEEVNRIYRALLDRGWRLADPARGVESDWVGGPHVNLVGPNGEGVHFPVPPGFVP